MKNKINGFTVVEIIFISLVVAFTGVVFFVQKSNIEVIARDNTKKTAINSMYYGLEEVFYATNGYYPQQISSENLKSVDPALFKDPSGLAINKTGSDYSYTPLNCNDNKCKKYQLKAVLENESDFVKESRN